MKSGESTKVVISGGGQEFAGSEGVSRPKDAPPLDALFGKRPPGVVSPFIFAIYILAVFTISGASYVTRAPLFVTFALVILGFSLIGITMRLVTAEKKLSQFVGANVIRSREEFEAISDRMWELQESEERFRGLTNALGDIVVHRDQDGRIVYTNPVFVKLLGCTAADVRGRTLAELGIKVGKLPDAGLFSDEVLTSQDVAIKTADETRWYSWIELSARDETTGMVSHRAIARDITPRKKAEEEMSEARERAEFASQAKSRFLATVSHEIRTPMNGILGMAKLLADTGVSQEQKTYIDSVITSADSLMILIEDLLDFSKIEAGRMEIKAVPISPRETIESVVELLSARAYVKDIGLGCYIDPAIPGEIKADPGRLRQVLINLIGNAIKFTEKGGVLVKATALRKRGVPHMNIVVEDSGQGLKKSDRKRIFEEFEQADTTSTREHGGAGLGLAISKRIVDAMGGELKVSARKGGGSIFTVSIPLQGIRQERQEKADALAGQAILVVSTNEMESFAISSIIERAGGKATRASSISKAAAKIAARKKKFDTLLIDAALESSDCKAISQLRDAGFDGARTVTIIAPTARGRLPQLFESGYTSFLARPVRGNTLVRQLSGSGTQDSAPVKIVGNNNERPHLVRGMTAMSILLAEDNPINATLARVVLEKAGHEVTVVEDGLSAVKMYSAGKNEFDLILMDLHMPVMDGLDAITAIRTHEEETGRAAVPILVLTADGQEETETSVFAHGADGFLTKPLDPARLITTIEAKAA